MLRALGRTADDLHVTADVAVVGAGLAGLFLAHRLAEGGVRVAVLESGREHQDADLHPLNAVETRDQPYDGADKGRFRCLGGTSTRWGGALLPYLAADLAPHGLGWHDGWGITAADLAPYLSEAERLFGVASGPYDEGDTGLLPGFVERHPKWPSFAKRSTAALFRGEIEADHRIDVWLDATVTGIRLGDGSVQGVVADSENGRRITVDAPQVVLAAGALETTRLLLLLDRAEGHSVFPQDTPLGAGFHDHASAPIADLEAVDRRALARLFAFHFVPGGMRNTRFELAPEVRQTHELPAAFAHVAFTRDPDSGFEGLRGLFQAVQARSRPSLRDLAAVVRDAPWFARAVWWRLAERRVLPPAGAGFELHLVTEQAPAAANRIDLSQDKVDRFGQPLARLTWAVRDDDANSFWHVAEHTVGAWSRGQVARVATLKERPKSQVLDDLRSGGGIYHPAGTTRIGADAASGVVDGDLRVHGVPGLSALATSVFPSVGGSSPSLTLVLLALRLGDRLVAAMRTRGSV